MLWSARSWCPEDDQVMAIMKSGKVIRSNVDEVKRTGRKHQGVTFAKPDKGDTILSIARNEGEGRARGWRRCRGERHRRDRTIRRECEQRGRGVSSVLKAGSLAYSRGYRQAC